MEQMAFNDVFMIVLLELIWPTVTPDGFVAYNYCEYS